MQDRFQRGRPPTRGTIHSIAILCARVLNSNSYTPIPTQQTVLAIDTNAAVHALESASAKEIKKLEDLEILLKRLQSPSAAMSGEEANLIEEAIRNMVGMRQIVKERVKTSNVVMDDMYFPLSLHGWGGPMTVHPINIEYPGLEVLPRVSLSRMIISW